MGNAATAAAAASRPERTAPSMQPDQRVATSVPAQWNGPTGARVRSRELQGGPWRSRSGVWRPDIRSGSGRRARFVPGKAVNASSSARAASKLLRHLGQFVGQRIEHSIILARGPSIGSQPICLQRNGSGAIMALRGQQPDELCGRTDIGDAVNVHARVERTPVDHGCRDIVGRRLGHKKR
jgi:hypothetical protein